MTRKKGRQLFHFNNLFLFQVFSSSRRQTLPSVGRSVSSSAHSCYKVNVIMSKDINLVSAISHIATKSEKYFRSKLRTFIQSLFSKEKIHNCRKTWSLMKTCYPMMNILQLSCRETISSSTLLTISSIAGNLKSLHVRRNAVILRNDQSAQVKSPNL